MALMLSELDQTADFGTIRPLGALQYYYTTYPGGKLTGQTYVRVSIPIYNPKRTGATLSDAYVYDSNGGLVDIKSDTVIESTYASYLIVQMKFTASHAGKTLLIGFKDT